MNEELRIIIKAVTKDAVKPIQDVKKELNALNGAGSSASSGIVKTMKGVKIAAAAAVAAVTAVTVALVKLGKSAVQFNREFSKLTTAFQTVGASAETAGEAYRGFYRFLGDTGKAVEAAAHVAKLATSQESLAEWTKISQGIYATFGDSLPIEGLTEAANETLRVGKVTGTLADALNWAGVSEDDFNAALANTSSFEEREILLRSTLNGLYMDAANIYEKNNKELLDYNESQARLNVATANASQACIPFLTALNNLGTALMNVLKPALDAVVPYITQFVNWLAKGIETVLSFFSALTGKSAAIKTVAELGKAKQELGNAANGAGDLASGLDQVGAAAKEAKKHLQGFDELNVLQADTSASASGGAPGYSAPAGGYFDNASFEAEIQEGEDTIGRFIEDLKLKFETLKTIFEPTITAWSGAFDKIKDAWNNSKQDFADGATSIISSLGTIITYVAEEFIPNIINSFSVNFAPIFGDIIALAIEEAGKTFKWFGELCEDVTNDIIMPALQFLENIVTDTFDTIGKSWGEYGAPLVEQVGKAFENIRKFITDLYEKFIKPVWDKILKVLERVWKDGLQPLIKRVSDFVLKVSTLLLKLYNETIAPVVNWIMDKVYPIIVDVIGAILDVLGDLLIDVTEIFGGVLDVIEGVIQFVVGVFTGDWKSAWEGVKLIFQGVWKSLGGIVQGAWDTIMLILKPVGTFFTSLWTQIKKIFEPVGQWFKGIFTTAWTNIKNVFSGWGSFFSGLWNNIKNTFKGLGTTLGNAIGGAVKSGINGVITMIENTINKAVDLINGAIKLINKLPGVSVGNINRLSLPRLAEGGIANSATIAMIGEAGKEAVLPLENNTEWMDKLADKIAARNGGQTKVILQLNDRELGWATIDAINAITRQTGGLQLAL